jgi:hypothetical protein
MPIVKQYKGQASLVYDAYPASYFTGYAMQLPKSLYADSGSQGGIILPLNSPEWNSFTYRQIYKLL